MKISIRRAVVALMVVAGIVAGGSAARAQSLPATKIGTVNMGLMFTKYRKAEILKKELEGDLAPIKAEAEKIKNIVKQHVDYLKAAQGKNPAQDEISRKAVKDGERAMEDLELRARTQIVRKQESHLVTIYKDIHAAVQIYAQQNGYHIVMAYGEQLEGDPFSLPVIGRKMQAFDSGSAVAYYVQPNLDISNDVLARLNSNFAGQAGTTNGGQITPTGLRQP